MKRNLPELLWLTHGWMLGRNSAENHWLQATNTCEQRKRGWNQSLAEVRKNFAIWRTAKCQLPSLSSANVISTAPGRPSQFWDSHRVLVFMSLSTDILITTWAQALACWLWSQSCITCKRTAWHSSVNTCRNISQCARLPGHVRIRFHPAAQKAGLLRSVLKYTFSYLLPECQF